MIINHKGDNMFNGTANTNPETYVPFGYVAANDLNQDLVDQLIYGGVNESQLECEFEIARQMLHEYIGENEEVDLPSPGEEVTPELLQQLIQLLEERDLTWKYEQQLEHIEVQEPHIHGECEGVKYATSWLGGALNFFIIESPVITTKACRASPCVPNAGILKHPEDHEEGSVESYGIPEDWWAECR